MIATLWYGPNFHRFMLRSKAIASMNTIGSDVFDSASITYYLRLMVADQIGLPFFAVFMFGLLRLNKCVRAEHAWLLLVWGVSIYVVQTVVPHKRPGQDIGILLPARLISASGISSLGRWRKLGVVLIGSVGVLQFLVFTLPDAFVRHQLGKVGWVYGSVAWPRGARPPKREDWKIEQALRSLAENSLKVGVLSDHASINGQTFNYYVREFDLPFQVLKCRDHSADFLENLRTYDFVVVKSDWVPTSGLRGNPFLPEDVDLRLVKHFHDHIEEFGIFRSFPLPDGSDLLVYRNAVY